MQKKKSRVKRKLVIALTAVTVVVASMAHDKFTDVPDNYWAHDTISWGVEQNIINGYEDGSFKPNQDVTEAEFLKMFISAFSGNQAAVDAGDWASGYYKYAKARNWAIKGYSNKKLANQKINRTRVAEIVTGAVGVNYGGEDAIRYMLANGLASGRGDTLSVEGYEGSSLLTRSEAIQFIKNLMDKGITEVQDRPNTPSNPEDIPKLPDEEGQSGAEVKLHEVSKAEADPDMARTIGFMPKDTTSQPFVEEFLDGVSIKDGKATVKVPSSIPKGYTVYLTGIDGTTANVKVSGGESKTFTIMNGFGMSMWIGTVSKQSVSITDTGEVYWGAVH